jgi:uncharacterized protein YecT (DUF1311 family)
VKRQDSRDPSGIQTPHLGGLYLSYTAQTTYRIGKTMLAFNSAVVTTSHRSAFSAGLSVAQAMYLLCAAVTSFAIAGCQDRSASALTEVLAPPECRVRDEYGFGCYAKYLAGLEQQVRSILQEIATYNAAHRTSFAPKQTQTAWENSRQTRCGAAPSWDPNEPNASFARIECYMEVTDSRFEELDSFVRELPK